MGTKKRIEDLPKYVESQSALKPVYATKFLFTSIISGVDETTFETNAYPGVYIDPVAGVYYVKNGEKSYAGGESRTILKPDNWLVYRPGKTTPSVEAIFNGELYPGNLQEYKRKGSPGSYKSTSLAYQIQEAPAIASSLSEKTEWAKNHYKLDLSLGRPTYHVGSGYGAEIEVFPGSWVIFRDNELYGIWSDEYFREKYEVPPPATPLKKTKASKVESFINKADAAAPTLTKVDIRELSDSFMKVVTTLDQIEKRLT